MKRLREIPGPDLAASFERGVRRTQPSWAKVDAGRLPVRQADGSLALPAPRPRPAAGEDEASDGEGEGEDGDEDSDDDGESAGDDGEEDDGEGGEDEDEDGEEAAADGRGGAAARRADSSRDRGHSRPSGDAAVTLLALRALPPPALLERRARLRARVAALSEAIVADPERNISAVSAASISAASAAPARGGRASAPTGRAARTNSLLALQGLCGDADPVVRRLALLSCAAVFRDLRPGYAIRLPTEKEAAVRLKKDVRRLRDFEANLLRGYQRFLRLLEFTVERGERAGRALVQARQREAALRRRGGGGGGAGGGVASGGSLILPLDPAPVRARGFEVDSGQGAEGNGGSASVRRREGQGDFNARKTAEKRDRADRLAGLVEHAGDDAETLHALGVSALGAMAELLHSAPHFNFRSNLVNFIVPRMSSSDDEIAAAASEGVETLFSSDTSFEASLDAAQALARAAQDSVAASEARAQQHAHKQAPSHAATQRIRLRARAVLSLARLPLNVLERIDGHVASAGKHGRGAKKRKARSEEEKAAEADIDAGLRAADAEALDVRKRYAKGALKAVVTVFFRVLRAPTHAELLPAVVRGLSKFAHLIDVGIVTDLLACLKQLVRASMLSSSEDDSGKRLTAEGNESFSAPAVHLSVECALNCVLAALRIMAGPGQQLLNADETDFTRCLYGTLPRLVDEAAQSGEVEPASRDSAVEASSTRQDSPVPAPLLAAHCVQALLLNRRELSSARVESFTRRLLTVAAHLPPAGSLALMSCVRGLANRYPAAARILSAPPATSSASSLAAAASDPTMLLARGAHSALFAPDAAQRGPEAVGWELGGLMLRHFHPAVRAAAAAASDNAPLLPSESANAVFAAFDCDSTGAFNPPVRAPPPHPLAARLADAEKRAAASKSAGERHVRAFFIREPLPAGSLAAMADDGVLSLSDASCEADFARRKAAEAAHAVTIVAQVASAKASFDAAQRKLHAAGRSARR